MWAKKLASGAVALMAAATVAACGSSERQGDGGGDASAIVAEAKARVEAAKAEVRGAAPDSGPPVQRGKSVVLIPCSIASEGCAVPAKGAEEAAKAIGWKTKIIDGKDTAATQNAAVRQALALKPDAIITFAINPDEIQGALAEARRSGIKVIASSALPSDLVDFSDNPNEETWALGGSLLADYAIARHEGDVKALVLHDTGFDVLRARHRAFVDRLKECASCEIVEEQTFTFSDLATSVPRLVQQMAQRNPEFNTVYIDYDYAVPAVLQGLRAIGARDKTVLGSEGTSNAIASIRDGEQTATTALALPWIGWSDIDALNRIFAGEDPQPAADVLSVKVIDRSVAEGMDGMWDGDVDFRAEYGKLWGLDR